MLTQIIFELENKDGQNMLPISFLRQLISFYGDQMQMIVPSFLEQSMIAFAKEQERFREQMKSAIGKIADGHDEGGDADQGDRGADAAQHRAVPERHAHVHALPHRNRRGAAGVRAGPPGAAGKNDELQELKDQIAAMQRKIELDGVRADGPLSR